MSVQTLNSLDEKIEMEKSSSENHEEKRAEGSQRVSTRAVLQIANLSYCWFATIFVYYGLNLNSVYLEYWNKHINFIVSRSRSSLLYNEIEFFLLSSHFNCSLCAPLSCRGIS
jgi:hypothetical protein